MNRTISFVLLLTFVSSVLYAAEPGKAKLRTWKDVTGKFSVQAVFVRVRSGQAVLRRTDNKEISVPITKLSVTDRQYVQFFHAVAVLGKLDAKIKRNKQGDVIEVIGDRRFINPVLVHLKGLTKLQTLHLGHCDRIGCRNLHRGRRSLLRVRLRGFFKLFRRLVAVDRRVADRLGRAEFDLPVQQRPVVMKTHRFHDRSLPL